MKTFYRVVQWGAIFLFAQLSLACSLTKIEKTHSLLQPPGTSRSASVYILRPEAERRMGFPDNNVTVELNNEKLMEIGKGEYTLVSLVPRDYTMTLRNLTERGPEWDVVEMARDYRFEFVPGGTYFIVIDMVDAEFRGIRFAAKAVDLFEAQQLAKNLRAVGYARSAKLKSL